MTAWTDLGSAKSALELLAAVANIAVEAERIVPGRSLARGYLQEIAEHIGGLLIASAPARRPPKNAQIARVSRVWTSL